MPQISKFLVELQYLPPVEYFAAIVQHDVLLIEAFENYQKQTYRNRCYINGANNVQILSIPVKKGNQKIKIKEVAINYAEKWPLEHWRSIQSAYGKAPFFEFYASFLEPVYNQKITSLFDFNFNLLTICLEILQIKTQIALTSDYQEKYNDNLIKDARSSILPSNRTKNSPWCDFTTYQQVFGTQFTQNMSIIDLIFCLGPEAPLNLAQCVKNKKQT